MVTNKVNYGQKCRFFPLEFCTKKSVTQNFQDFPNFLPVQQLKSGKVPANTEKRI